LPRLGRRPGTRPFRREASAHAGASHFWETCRQVAVFVRPLQRARGVLERLPPSRGDPYLSAPLIGRMVDSWAAARKICKERHTNTVWLPAPVRDLGRNCLLRPRIARNSNRWKFRLSQLPKRRGVAWPLQRAGGGVHASRSRGQPTKSGFRSKDRSGQPVALRNSFPVVQLQWEAVI